jgi:hypothetical protein
MMEEYYSIMKNDVWDMRSRWIHDTLKDTKRHATPMEIFKESRPPQRSSSYVALMSSTIDFETSSFEETTCQ